MSRHDDIVKIATYTNDKTLSLLSSFLKCLSRMNNKITCYVTASLEKLIVIRVNEALHTVGYTN